MHFINENNYNVLSFHENNVKKIKKRLDFLLLNLDYPCEVFLFERSTICGFILSEPVVVVPERALSDRTESEPSRLPDSAPDGASQPAHTHTHPLLQEETPSGQQRPQQVRRSLSTTLGRVEH